MRNALSFDWKTKAILKVLKENANKYLNCSDISKQYMPNEPTTSDKLTTLNICNVLSAAGLIIRREVYPTRSKRVEFIIKELSR
jgi:hypothetical protein